MKVSVVIPAYNEERYITKSLKSLLNQSQKPDEIIVVDNNSTDNTAKIAREMGVKVISEKKQGMIPARNKGFDSAKYDIIARTDADSVVNRNWIKTIKHNFETRSIDALSGPIVFYDTKIKATVPIQIYTKSMQKVLKGNYILQGSNMALTKATWKKVKNRINLSDSKVHEDIDLSINIVKINGKIGYDNSLLVQTSARRIKKNPLSFFVEYPVRLFKTLLVNSQK